MFHGVGACGIWGLREVKDRGVQCVFTDSFFLCGFRRIYEEFVEFSMCDMASISHFPSCHATLFPIRFAAC